MASGAELLIQNERVLYLYGDSTIDGTLRFGGPWEPTVNIMEDLTFSGSGTIVAAYPTRGGIHYNWEPEPVSKLTIAEGSTVRGNILITTDFRNLGTFIVDDAADIMVLGWFYNYPLDFTRELSGDGEFIVSAGTMWVGDLEFFQDGVSTWTVSSTGTPKILEDSCVECDEFWGELNITGGTLVVQENLCVSKGVNFSGGTIDVWSGVYAEFGGSCP